jgi:hypothetical protein
MGPRRDRVKWGTLRERRDPADPDACVASWILAFARMTLDITLPRRSDGQVESSRDGALP